jgi:Ca2+-binding EF-hand superfamily protein
MQEADMRWIQVASCAVLLSAGSAMAAQMESDANATSPSTMSRDKGAFDALDTNKDGYISKSEAQQSGIPDYSAADRNGDGRLDQNEYSASAKNSTNSRSSTSSMSKSDTPHADSGTSSSRSDSSY